MNAERIKSATRKEVETRKRKEAEARQSKYDGLTTDQKVKVIESRPGDSTKELDRLGSLPQKKACNRRRKV